MIGERMEVTPMIDIDPQSGYHFGCPLTIKVNNFEDLQKIHILYEIDCGCYIKKLHIWASPNRIRDRLNQLRMEF